jgi:hypothetical protein
MLARALVDERLRAIEYVFDFARPPDEFLRQRRDRAEQIERVVAFTDLPEGPGRRVHRRS